MHLFVPNVDVEIMTNIFLKVMCTQGELVILHMMILIFSQESDKLLDLILPL